MQWEKKLRNRTRGLSTLVSSVTLFSVLSCKALLPIVFAMPLILLNAMNLVYWESTIVIGLFRN